MPFLNQNNKPLDPGYLRRLGEEEAREREKREMIAIEVAKRMGELDEDGNPTHPDEFETDQNFVPEAPPPQRQREGDPGPVPEEEHSPSVAQLVLIDKVIAAWTVELTENPDTDHKKYLDAIRDIVNDRLET